MKALRHTHTHGIVDKQFTALFQHTPFLRFSPAVTTTRTVTKNSQVSANGAPLVTNNTAYNALHNNDDIRPMKRNAISRHSNRDSDVRLQPNAAVNLSPLSKQRTRFQRLPRWGPRQAALLESCKLPCLFFHVQICPDVHPKKRRAFRRP